MKRQRHTNTICAVDGCENDRRRGHAYCPMHVSRLRQRGDLGPAASFFARNEGACSVEGCSAAAAVRDMCRLHYERFRNHGSTDPRPRGPKPRDPVPCTVDNCERSAAARGWCHRHWRLWRANGKPDVLTTEDRFWRKVDKETDPDGCWTWTGGTTSAGYALFKFDGTFSTAHRYVYQLVIGPIPEGLHIDHLCNNGRGGCVRPDHLEAVTPAENNRRAGTRRDLIQY